MEYRRGRNFLNFSEFVVARLKTIKLRFPEFPEDYSALYVFIRTVADKPVGFDHLKLRRPVGVVGFYYKHFAVDVYCARNECLNFSK